MPPLTELPVKGVPARVRERRGLNRRQALSLLASGIATSLAACSKPDEEIVPYVRMPERLVPGQPLRFATTLPLSGLGRGVIVTSVDGRPIKIEGNPRHPASLGATDVFAEAAVLSLYDPDRSRTALNRGAIASQDAFRLALRDRLQHLQTSRGTGLRLLTGPVTSPTLLRQIDELLDLFPGAAWHAYDPAADDAARAGSVLAFGRPLQVVPRLEQARVVLALDADPLGHGPDQCRLARGFASRRTAPGDTSRIYSIEAVPTLTGAKADHRMALHPGLINETAIALANLFGAGLRETALPDAVTRFITQAAQDLRAQNGHALVLGGPSLAPPAQALVHWINTRLQAPCDLIDFAALGAGGHAPRMLADLARDIDAGAVDTLVMLDVNPVYDAPADFDFARRLKSVEMSVHLGGYPDETALESKWHLPQLHPLEAWSDLRAIDGTASIVQPLIKPLYRGISPHELLAQFAGRSTSAYELVQETWRPNGGADFDGWWRRVLHDGVIPAKAPASVQAEAALPDIATLPCPTPSSMAVVLRPDPMVWDGGFANNAWLQECPKPLTKQVWGNALALNPRDAATLGVATGDVVHIAAGDRALEAPVMIEPGLPNSVSALTLGYGRSAAGAIGNRIGANAYALRRSDSPCIVEGVTLTKTGRREQILTTQNVVRGADVRELYPLHDAAAAAVPAVAKAAQRSLLPPPTDGGDGAAWAMVIDTSICIGCNACVVACQSENNVPVVGPEEVARGRDMHWLRVDVYDHGTTDAPKPGFQPVPCMHCEQAPCEPVCPVAASVHDSEGLNVQVYNRCVGTRFCEANCPYKVRRFNFFGYADGQEYANLGVEAYRGQKNPEVTVRARGVMEKCTYCVQRISAARRDAERDDRSMAMDEVRTACQSACPTQAITFGDRNQSAAAVNRKRADARHYTLLGHLGTRPRTTYLADIRNAAPGLDEDRI